MYAQLMARPTRYMKLCVSDLLEPILCAFISVIPAAIDLNDAYEGITNSAPDIKTIRNPSLVGQNSNGG